MTDSTPSPEKRLHLVFGEPDPEHCPICRAHVPGPGSKSLSDEEVGEILIQVLSLGEILRCSCPLCEAVRREPLEG
jgi:hypothetical protein